MGKMESKNNNISFQHCVKTVINALTALEDVQRKKNLRKSETDTSHSAAFSSTELITGKGFEAVRKVKSLSLRFISSILITLFCLIGCSDMPYTGSVLTPDDIVDRYIVSPEKGKVCLQNGTDSACLLTLVPKRRVEVDGVSAPIIHIHPRKLTYVFYYNGKQIVHAERVMDTTEIVETLTEQIPTADQSGGSGNIGGDGATNGNGNTGRTPLPPLPPVPPPPSRTPATLAGVSGNGQSGEINQYLANPLVVKVLDQHGAPLLGVEVSFTVRPSSGVLSPMSATTGVNGEVSTILQLGNTVGTYTVTASVPDIAQDVSFTATATDPPRPTALRMVSGDGQSGEVNQNLANPFVVKVFDQSGDALSGVTVNFTVSPSGGVLSPTSATTGSNGETSTILQLGDMAGTYTVTASVFGIPQDVSFTATATDPPRPTALRMVSGDSQSGEVNQNLANSLVVKVLDQHGAVLSGVTVSFSVSPTDGTLNPVSATTDANGEASTILQLGGTAGSYTVTARVSGITQDVSFTATATDPPPPPPPSRIPITLEKRRGDNQSGETNQYLANPLVVRVLDQDNAVLSGVEVSFTVNPSSGILSSATATTDANGEASTALRFGRTTGTYTVTARVSDITQDVSFTATATDPPPSRSPSRTPTALQKVSGDSQSGEINQHLTNPLVVKVLDQHGAVLSGVTVSFTVNPSSGTLGSASATTGSNGETSTTLQLGSTAGSYTVTARVSGISQSVSFTATATDPPRPTTLEKVSGDSQSNEINQHLANSLVVRVLDQHSAELSGVTVSFSVNPSDGTLNPTSATTNANGEASTALQLGTTAGTYTLTASVSGITQDVTFTATATDPPRPTTLERVSGNAQSGEINQNLANSLVVRVLDQHGAVLSGVTVSFSVNPSDGVLSPASDTTDANGEASTILQLGATAGTYTVTARVSGITQDVSFTATATDPPPPPPPARVSTTLEKRRGDNQSGETNQYLANPLVVRVLDQDNAALSGVEVSFTVDPNSGILGSATATTDANGEASTTLRFGRTTGTYTVTASVSNIAQDVEFTATATDPPFEEDWAQQSHFYDDTQSKQGWLVWIYYPENYDGPMDTPGEPGEPEQHGFEVNGFEITLSHGTLLEFAQTEGACYDADKPCHIGTPGDYENSTTYSVQIFIKTTVLSTTFKLEWNRRAENWTDGSPPPNMIYSLDSDKNTMLYTHPMYDEDHTAQ